jgi:CheY-like chemotaxis protein
MRHASPVPTVLLVHSAHDDRAMYAEYLRTTGFCPVEVGDTQTALSQAEHADIIVTGILVPGQFDGVELVRRLRSDARTREKPIIVLTACAWQHERSRAEAAGCDAFLTKPCLPSELVRELLRQLSPSTRRRLPITSSGQLTAPAGRKQDAKRPA